MVEQKNVSLPPRGWGGMACWFWVLRRLPKLWFPCSPNKRFGSVACSTAIMSAQSRDRPSRERILPPARRAHIYTHTHTHTYISERANIYPCDLSQCSSHSPSRWRLRLGPVTSPISAHVLGKGPFKMLRQSSAALPPDSVACRQPNVSHYRFVARAPNAAWREGARSLRNKASQVSNSRKTIVVVRAYRPGGFVVEWLTNLCASLVCVPDGVACVVSAVG